MTVQVVIPYLTTDAWRHRAAQLVGDLYREELPWPVKWTLIPADSRGMSARLARARNEGAGIGEGLIDGDVIVFNDADSLCQPENIHRAVELAAEAPGLVFAWDTYYRLSQKTTGNVGRWQDAFEQPVAWGMYESLSAGCMAISRRCFQEVGGFDPSWATACEDYDFADRCNRLWPNRRVAGELIHLWHPRPAVEPENTRDGKRWANRAAA